MNKYYDMFLSTGIYMWFQLEENGEDLSLVTLNDYSVDNCCSTVMSIGEMPDALMESIVEANWNCIFSVAFKTDASGLGWVFSTKWTEWALRNGVAPYQPFCIYMDGTPEYYTTCDGECDVSFAPWGIVEKEKMSTFEASRHWEHWFMLRARYRDKARTQMHRLLYLRNHDLNAMYLSHSDYWTSGSYYDDPPGGIRVMLCTRHTQVEGFNKVAWCTLAEGRDDKGNYATALNELVKEVRKELPHLNEEFVRGLPKRGRF